MTPQEAFVQAIIETPDDDDVRLIYADWLEERDDPRAEFIRLQIELARYSPGLRPTALTQREHFLLQAHGREWAAPLAEFVSTWSFQRGFVDQVTIRTQDFGAVIDQVVRLTPLAHLTLANDTESALSGQFGEDAAVFGTDPPLAHLRSLNLSNNGLTDWDVRTLSAWTSLDRLEALDLSQNRIGPSAVRALAVSDVFARLVELNLSHNALTSDSVRTLEQAMIAYRERGQVPRLEVLDLRGNAISAAGRQELRRTRFVQRVALVDAPASRLGNAGSARLNP